MSNIKLVAVVAMASNRVIGKDGDLPWHLPEDLRFFKETTKGSKVIMGRQTFDSIVGRLGKPLPGRLNLVLSRQWTSNWPQEQVQVYRTYQSILSEIPFRDNETLFVIGGAELYKSLLHQLDEILLTYVYEPYDGDAFFPAFEHLFEMKEVLFRTPEFEVRRFVKAAN